MDETSHILKIQTGKQLYKQGHKNVKEITKEELKINLFGALNITGESVIYPMSTLKNNKNDDEATLSRKLGKHCKRESTENPKKQEEIKLDHILNLLNNDFLTENLKFERRIVLILDNVPTHRSDFTFQVANLLNIYLLFLPEYSPELNPIEGSWDYSKLHLKKSVPKNSNFYQKVILI